MSFLTYVFARLYGYMLGRDYRNTPEEACADAVTPFMIVVGLPAILACLVVVALIFPGVLLTKARIPWLTVPSGILLYFLTRPFSRYAQTPEIAAPFRSSASRRITIIVYLIVIVMSVLIAGVTARSLAGR
jgi:hypothetical protein